LPWSLVSPVLYFIAFWSAMTSGWRQPPMILQAASAAAWQQCPDLQRQITLSAALVAQYWHPKKPSRSK
jgi:hypothetical protein